MRTLFAAALAVLCLIPQPALSMGKAPTWLLIVLLMYFSLIGLIRSGPLSLPKLLLCALLMAVALRPDELAYSGGLLLGITTCFLARDDTFSARKEQITGGAFTFFIGWTILSIGLWFHYEILPFWTQEGWPGAPRLVSPLGHANYTSGLGALLAPACFAVAWERRKNATGKLALGAGAAASFCLIAGGSRAALAASGFIMVAVGLAWWIRSERSKAWLVFIPAAGLLVAIAHPTAREWWSNPTIRFESDLIRWDFAKAAWSLFKEHPLTGAAQVPLALMSHQPAAAEHYSCYQVHSTPLQWLCQFGIGGLLLYLALLFLVGREAIRLLRSPSPSTLRIGVVASLLSYLLFACFDYQLNIPAIALPFFVMLGWLLKPTSPQKRGILAPKWSNVIVATSIAVLSVGLFPEACQRFHLWRAASLKTEGTGPLLAELAQAHTVSDNPVVDALIASYAMNAIPETQEERQLLDAIAESAWNRACQSRLAMPQFFLDRAKLHATREPNLAITYAREAILRFPKQPQAWLLLANLYEAKGDAESALRFRAVAVLISPDVFYSHYLRQIEAPKQNAALLESIQDLRCLYEATHPDDSYALKQWDTAKHQMSTWAAASACVRSYFSQSSPADKFQLAPDLSSKTLKARLSSAYFRAFGQKPTEKEAESLLSAWVAKNPPGSEAAMMRLVSAKTELGTFGMFSLQGDHPVLPGFFDHEEDLFALWAVYSGQATAIRLDAEFLRNLCHTPGTLDRTAKKSP